MNDYSYKPSRSSRLIGLILVLVGIAHVLLMVGADSVLSSIQGSLLGRKVITVEIFGEDKIKANAPNTNEAKPKALPANIPAVPNKPQQSLPRIEPTLPAKPPQESSAAGTVETLASTNEASSVNSNQTNSSQTTESAVITLPVQVAEVKKPEAAPADGTSSETANNPLATQVIPDLVKMDLPKVGQLRTPQNYVFEVFQGEASDAKTVGRIHFDLEVNNFVYQSRFALRFNWITRLIAEDREWVSQGQVDDTGLKPQKVTELRGKRTPKVMVLDNEKAVGKVADAAFQIQRGLQDRTSIIWQFSLLAKSNPERYARGTEFDFPLLVSSKMVASKWRSKLETISVGGRNMDAIHFVRTDQRDDDVRFEFWLSSELDMSPVKLTISDGKGRKFDVVREKLS
jgi:Protein of unknown function (DUF3108)